MGVRFDEPGDDDAVGGDGLGGRSGEAVEVGGRAEADDPPARDRHGLGGGGGGVAGGDAPDDEQVGRAFRSVAGDTVAEVVGG